MMVKAAPIFRHETICCKLDILYTARMLFAIIQQKNRKDNYSPSYELVQSVTVLLMTNLRHYDRCFLELQLVIVSALYPRRLCKTHASLTITLFFCNQLLRWGYLKHGSRSEYSGDDILENLAWCLNANQCHVYWSIGNPVWYWLCTLNGSWLIPYYPDLADRDRMVVTEFISTTGYLHYYCMSMALRYASAK